MKGQTRYVWIRGYNVKVVVSHKSLVSSDCWMVVLDNGTKERVPEHNFYHRHPVTNHLELRDTPEFWRKWPNHPIEIELLPQPII